jgi:hypothetical protein
LERYESVGACEALEFCSQRLAELEGAGACQLYCQVRHQDLATVGDGVALVPSSGLE